MPGDLYSRAFGALSGTMTSDAYDVSRYDVLEVFARGGSQVGTAGGTVVVVHIDAQDVDGNWFTDAAGSFNVGTATEVAKAFKRGENIGAANPAVFGMNQRVRLVTSGSVEFGINIVGY